MLKPVKYSPAPGTEKHRVLKGRVVYSFYGVTFFMLFWKWPCFTVFLRTHNIERKKPAVERRLHCPPRGFANGQQQGFTNGTLYKRVKPRALFVHWSISPWLWAGRRRFFAHCKPKGRCTEFCQPPVGAAPRGRAVYVVHTVSPLVFTCSLFIYVCVYVSVRCLEFSNRYTHLLDRA